MEVTVNHLIFCFLSLPWSDIRNLVVCQIELGVIEVDIVDLLQFLLELDFLFVNLLGESLLNYFRWHLVHSIDVDVDFVASSNCVWNFLNGCSVDLIHVRAQ